MRNCGGLGVTKRGELRLLEPRIPGTGALFFYGPCQATTVNVSRRQDGEYAKQPLQDLWNGGNWSSILARGKSRAIEGDRATYK